MISKAVLVGLLVVGAIWLQMESQSMDQTQEFQDWMQEHKVQFASQAEQYYRAWIFHKNVEAINAHNLRNDVSYKMAVNQFTIYTEEEFTLRYLSQIRVPKIEKIEVKSIKNENNAIEIDWQAKGAVGPVKNQGACGSAGSFSTIGGIEGLAFITTKKFEAYSEQELIDCVYGCGGGMLLSGYQYIKSYGACTESEYPYTGKQGTCNSKGCSFKIFGIQSINNCPDLELAINNQPVSVAVDASRWSPYSSGIFSNCATALNHMVLLTAMDTDFWRVKNSWGTAWGEKGYIRLARGNTCGICLFAVAPVK